MKRGEDTTWVKTGILKLSCLIGQMSPVMYKIGSKCYSGNTLKYMSNGWVVLLEEIYNIVLIGKKMRSS